MDLDPSPVNHLGILPAHMLVEVLLPAFAVGQILASNDMGRSEEMVLHSRLKIEQRPDTVLCSNMRVAGSYYPKSSPVTDGRVLVGHIGLDPQNRLPFCKSSVQHLLP